MQGTLFTISLVVNEPEVKHLYHYVIDGRIVKSWMMTDECARKANDWCEEGHQIQGRYIREDKYKPSPEKKFNVRVEKKIGK